MEKKIEKKDVICLCSELQEILDAELKIGNMLLTEPCLANWPYDGSVFASLEKPLTIGKSLITDNIQYHLNEDMHFGWIDSCECKIHHDLLVAGELITTR